ncbi:MAG: DEAD/DEAH box helicase [Flavobacterium sp.]|nr:MAG: DEAD/DEAH box helicase [Flavobacterium sp.]
METRTSSKKLYDYQQRDIESIFEHISSSPASAKLVYQLPTGGGKTVVFSEIAKRYIEQFGKSVAVLTHRKELCRQTSATLKSLGVKNKIISSETSDFKIDCGCYVAMVETLRNRIRSKKIDTGDVGLVIIDEAHHNSFRKLLENFKNAIVIGVTATPLSSDITKPMKRHYKSLITGESIAQLIDSGFLAAPQSFAYEVELNSLKTGIHGDYTVSSSNELYSSPAMLGLLVKAYREHADGKKTLIFNNGIDTSMKVRDTFETEGIPIKHLDNRTPDCERKEILQWFKKTKSAVLTSVSILTTGFDEPTIQAVILNRATTSITLYHQMVGRGARRLPSKKTFSIIDLGNNIQRFGRWEEPVDWNFVFENPAKFAEQVHFNAGGSTNFSHGVPSEIRAQFPNTLEMAFDIESHYQEAIDQEKKPKTVIRESIRQHALMCLENSDSPSAALTLAQALRPEIEWRVKEYVRCLDRASKSYKEWLIEDYCETLRGMIKKLYARMNAAA